MASEADTAQNDPSPDPSLGLTGWAAFRHPAFCLVFATSFISGIATFAMQVAIGWEIWQATREEYYLGLVGLCSFLPTLLFFPITGMVADRFPRRLVLAICYTVQAASALLLFAVFTAETPRPVMALVVITLIGVGRAFTQPASQALLPNVVPVEHFSNAVAWATSGRQISMIAGPAVGGALLVLGAGAAFAVIAALFASCIVLIAFVQAAQHNVPRGPVTLETLFAGLQFIFDRRLVLGAISLDLFAVLSGSATALFPIYATDVLHVGELGLGFLRSVWAVGATSCALVMTHVAIRRNAGLILFISVAVYGLGTIVFSLSTSLYLSLAALFIAGASDMVSVYIRDNLVQLATPDDMRGRVQAVNSVFVMGSGDLGQVKSGLLAEAIGVVPSVTVGGIGVLVITAVWMKLFPRMRHVHGLTPADIERAENHG